MILVDVHPASVQLADGTVLPDVRVVITEARLRIWSASGHDVTEALDAALDGPLVLASRYPLIGQPFEVTTAVGAVEVTRLKGCGCKSPLKRFHPSAD